MGSPTSDDTVAVVTAPSLLGGQSPRPALESKRATRTERYGYYVYGVIATSQDRSFGPLGIGGSGEEVQTVRYKDVGVVVSRSRLVIYDPVKENSLAHNRVVEAVLASHAVIPAAFGTIFRTKEDLLAFAEATYQELRSTLAKIGDRREFGVKVFWRKEALREVLESYPELHRLKQQIARLPRHKTEGLRLRLGQKVQARMAQIGDPYRRDIYEHLKAAAVASRVNKPIGPRMILNAAFLVDREREQAFQQAIDALDDKHGRRVKWLYTGAWAPYNFVDIRIDIVPPGRERRRMYTYV